MKATWHKLPRISAPMPFQMALDEVLFRQSQEEKIQVPLIRFFFSSEPWITVGYSSLKRGNPYRKTAALIHRSRVPVCRRMTGGGSVLHGDDLIFSLIARKSAHEYFSSVRVSYLHIHEAVKAAMEKLGFSPRFYRCDERLTAGEDCFVFPVATDLELKGRKVAGGSQKRSAGLLLHEESIRVPDGMDAGDLVNEIERSMETVFGVSLQASDLDPSDLREAAKLARENYAPFVLTTGPEESKAEILSA